jgi:carboxyl-terminal processing protease
MRTLVLILLFIAVPLAGGSLKPELESEFWKGSGADADFASEIINDRDCVSSEQYFDSCRKALLLGAKIQNIERRPEFKKLAAAPFGPDFKFGVLLDAIVAAEKSGNPEWLIGRMINAQLKAFDPYGQLTPESYSEYLLNGENTTYYGTGLETQVTGEGLFVFAIFPQSPASRAGLRVHDRILSLNGARIETLSQAHNSVARMGGGPGTKLALEIRRDGRIFPVTLEVAPVAIPEDPAAGISMDGKNFLQVRLRNFSRGTCDNLKSRLKEAGPVAGLILDLRHNRGGLVEESECVVRLFDDETRIVSREPLQIAFPRALDFEIKQLPDNSKTRKGRAPYADLPLAVLTDAKSASASEIASGALQDFGRAWIVGERTYGKGTTQLVHQLKNHPRLTVTKTVSRYIRPSGLMVHAHGVSPDFEAPYRSGLSARGRRAIREENLPSPLHLSNTQAPAPAARPEQSAIRACLGDETLFAGAEEAALSAFGFRDHPASTALAVLTCALKHNFPAN